jgi:hypothetical protein
MKVLFPLIAILAIFTLVNFAARGKGKLSEPANKSIAALASCLRFVIYGILLYFGFWFAMGVQHVFFS